jgi:hypothetical protein
MRHLPIVNDEISRAYLAATIIIRYFLGIEFSERYIKPSATPDAFMLNGFDDRQVIRFIHQDRVINLANVLFNLNAEPGFDLLIVRFTSNRDLRSVFLEAMFASEFKKDGFTSEILPSSGIKGNDFDFRASKKETIINVEVTGATNDRFAPSNIKNILTKKRKQLPSDRPAILVCALPYTWLLNYPGLYFGLMHETFNFYRVSKGLNAVVYAVQKLERLEGAAIFIEGTMTFWHTNPRLPVDLSFLSSQSGDYKN